MQGFLESVFPNVASKLPNFYKSIAETLQMVGRAGIVIFIFGMLLGIALTVTKKDGILPNTVVYQLLDKVVNFFRSIPFIILLAGLIPLTRLI
jgi:D-methionine transport system permease protein